VLTLSREVDECKPLHAGLAAAAAAGTNPGAPGGPGPGPGPGPAAGPGAGAAGDPAAMVDPGRSYSLHLNAKPLNPEL
jgi:hypothetical protein